jgi:hypothetical protein
MVRCSPSVSTFAIVLADDGAAVGHAAGGRQELDDIAADAMDEEERR